eukprot:9040889-Pyramimonas_sp.AAC.1
MLLVKWFTQDLVKTQQKHRSHSDFAYCSSMKKRLDEYTAKVEEKEMKAHIEQVRLIPSSRAAPHGTNPMPTASKLPVCLDMLRVP